MKIKKTFIHQIDLPKLPIPPLQETKSKLLEWLKPLVSHEQYAETEKVVEHFFKEGGEAEKLQQKLREWNRHQDGNWLTPLWDDMYLQHRNSLPLTSNFNILLNRVQQPQLAAKICFLIREFYHMIIDETLEPQFFKGKPLDMTPYMKLFRSVRIPQKNSDRFYVADFEKRANHVVILYNNHFYRLPVTNEEGIPYSVDAISRAIKTKVFRDKSEGVNIGVFTTAERNEAAEIYVKLKQSPANAENLQMIADSLFILSIDQESESSEEALRNLMLHPCNKYFDKTIQIVITKHGDIGLNIEHSAVDGMTISTVVSHLNKGLQKEYSETAYLSEPPEVRKLEWRLTQEMEERLEQLETTYLEKTKDLSLLTTTFADFGKENIKELRLSPDAFFHMALQLAMFRTYGEFRSVYEPVSVGHFLGGRTECARATSIEKRTLVEAIEKGEESNATLYRLMQVASDAHSARIRACQKGMGVERHLFGLEQMYHRFGRELGMHTLPEIFQDPGYLTLCHDFISTSGTIYQNAKARMFAPVVRVGHGLAYFILDHTISLNLSSYIENELKGKQLMKHLIQALQELRLIAESEVFVEDIS